MLKTMVMLASSRAACSCAYRSRTIERTITAPLDMARPWTRRAAVTAATEVMNTAASDDTSISASADEQHRLAPEAVGQRPPEELAGGEAEEIRGERELRGGDLDLQSARASTGSDGTNRSVPSAGSAISTPRRTVRRREVSCLFKLGFAF